MDFKKSPGFGLMLVDSLTKQLKGSIAIERGNGTRIILEFDRFA
jgi:two-component sensor histidine kinase